MPGEAIQTGGPPPNVGDTARDIMGAMIAQPNKLPDGFGKATVTNDDGDTVYVIAIILGGVNVENTAVMLQRLQESTVPASDVFTEDGELKVKKKKKKRKRKRGYRAARRSPH